MHEPLNPADPKRVFLVDDHPVLLAGLRALLARDPGLSVSGAATNARDALAQIIASPVDLVLVEIGIGGLAGLELIQDLKIRRSRTRAMCFTAHEEVFFAERALRAGAAGFVMKTASEEMLLRAIHAVLAGQVYLSEGMSRMLLTRLAAPSLAPESRINRLSNRELQVVHHIGVSRDNRQIAHLMSVSLKTVEAHRSRIKEKLNLRTSSELIRFATQWVEHEDSFIDS